MAFGSNLSRAAWRGELRATLQLGWPLVLTNLAQSGLTMTDVIVLGHVGPAPLAAAALGTNLYLTVLLFGIGVIVATSPMMAEAIGRKHRYVRDIRRTFRQGLWAAVIISIPVWAILWHAETILLMFGQEAKVSADAQVFVHALQWGYLPALGVVALRSFVAVLERPLWALVVTAGTVLFNVLANWVLVFGHFGFPALGLQGSGIATALSNFVMFVALGLIVVFHRSFRRYHVFGNWWRPDWPRLGTIWRLGLPIGASLTFEMTVFSAAILMIGKFGTDAIAAHSIVFQIATFSFMVPMGLSQAATVRVGRAYGAGDVDGITLAGWTAFAVVISFMLVVSSVMLLFPHALMSVFIRIEDPVNAAVVSYATGFLLCAALIQIADGSQVVGAGMLRGLQDTKMPMLFALTGYWGISVPVGAMLAFQLGVGSIGVWIGMVTGIAFVACVMLLRWGRRARLGLLLAR